LAVVQIVQAAPEEGGAREQDHGESELADDEELAEALMAAISGGAAPSALESAVEIEPEGEVRGGDAEGEGREEAKDAQPSTRQSRAGATVTPSPNCPAMRTATQSENHMAT
jgi:hypothetical protein